MGPERNSPKRIPTRSPEPTRNPIQPRALHTRQSASPGPARLHKRPWLQQLGIAIKIFYINCTVTTLLRVPDSLPTTPRPATATAINLRTRLRHLPTPSKPSSLQFSKHGSPNHSSHRNSSGKLSTETPCSDLWAIVMQDTGSPPNQTTSLSGQSK